MPQWLAPRGLAFNEDKTRIVSLDRGFDFLGFNVRRYRNGKLLIKPSKAAVQTDPENGCAAEVKALRGANAEAVITRLNPIIRGWAAYYRSVVSKEIFSALDHYVWRLTYRWAMRAPPEQAEALDHARYFGAFNPSRQDRWVFGDRDSGRYLVKFSWTQIVRHQMVKGGASPDDPALTDYWAAAATTQKTPAGPVPTAAAPGAQHGRCPLCGDLLLHADHEPQSPHEWEQWFTRPARRSAAQAIAARPHRRPGRTRRTPPRARPLRASANRRPCSAGPAALPAREPRACLSRVPGKRHARF